jgi:hypothetical protein
MLNENVACERYNHGMTDVNHSYRGDFVWLFVSHKPSLSTLTMNAKVGGFILKNKKNKT